MATCEMSRPDSAHGFLGKLDHQASATRLRVTSGKVRGKLKTALVLWRERGSPFWNSLGKDND